MIIKIFKLNFKINNSLYRNLSLFLINRSDGVLGRYGGDVKEGRKKTDTGRQNKKEKSEKVRASQATTSAIAVIGGRK